ncbi:MAG: GreA/GreB family elongation factor [Candidatus Margulisiibacteriota bacterium]|jgi:transcription elongation factor GreA
MRVPIRKADKYTYLKTDPYITQAKFDELTKKRERLITVNRPREAEEVKRLALMGDFSENVGYQIAKGRLRGINQRVLDIENLLKNAVIIRHDKNNETVEVGNFVTLSRNGKEKEYQILGSEETNPTAGVISHNSPLGSALIGKKINDEIEIDLGDRKIKYKIVTIK